MTAGLLYAVDFDKTLTKSSSNEWLPADKQEPNKEMIEAVREQFIEGKKVVVWTAREWREAPKIAGWLTIHEVPYHGIKMEKGGADKYIDDKAMTPDEFIGEEVVMRVEN